MDKLSMKTSDAAAGNVAKIAALWPQCVTERIGKDGKPELAIDFDKLRDELSSEVIGEGEERYQFTWPDKRAASRLANTPSDMALRPCVAESVGKDGTPGGFDSENLYIEGDNLEVLKLLREAYLGKVKMIYIDPPYNTGNDFVYNDDFAMGADEFAERGAIRDDEGNLIVDPMQRNTESNGRFHTDWLNMMYPRLKVARDLLSEDGVIFISIDDNEVENLRKICDEVFGERNFVAQFPWRKRTAKSDVPFGVSQDYEWCLCYAKSADFKCSVEGKERKYFETPDFPGRPWRVHDLTKQTTASERPNSFFTIVDPKTGKEYPANPNRTWAITEETFNQYYNVDRIVFPGDYDFLNISKPVLRYWKEDDVNKAGEDFGRVAVSTKFPDFIGMSQDGTKEVTEILNSKIFSFPKPTSLIKFFATIINDDKALILDFFSGSATTAHAVMQLNAEDGGNRKFIMVQLPEVTAEDSEARKAGYANICEIGKERIRRAGRKVVSGQWSVISNEEKAKYGCRECSVGSGQCSVGSGQCSVGSGQCSVGSGQCSVVSEQGTVNSGQGIVVSDELINNEKAIYGNKELSGSDCLAKGDGSSQRSLFDSEEAAEGGDVRIIGSDEAGSSVNTLKHSGGAGTEFDEGVSAVSLDSTGLTGRAGDATAAVHPGGLPCPYGHFGGDGPAQGGGASAECPHKFTSRCPLTTDHPSLTTDIGFRVLKLDSSNMVDVFYTPEDFSAQTSLALVDNVKQDRTAEDLLFQIMPELNIPLSAKIEVSEINGKKVFVVDDGYLIATFDKDVNTDAVKAMAQMQPQYFVMRDASAESDNVLDDFEQIFRHYSPDTVRKIV